MKIALYNRDRAEGIEAVKTLLRERGATLACYGTDFTSWEDLPADTGLFLSLGGDGTFLQALTFVRDRHPRGRHQFRPPGFPDHGPCR